MCNLSFRRTPHWPCYILLNLRAEDKNASSHDFRGEMTSADQIKYSLPGCANNASGLGLRNIFF